MSKKLLCLLLCFGCNTSKEVPHLDKSLIEIKPIRLVEEKPKRCDFDIIITAVKACEGLSLKSHWDVNHWSIGYGTPSTEGSTTTIEKADSNMRFIFINKYESIGRQFPGLNNWSRLVLAMTRYNVRKFGPRLCAAIKKNDKKLMAKILMLYVYDSNGKHLKGRVNRRKIEVDLLLSSQSQRQNIADKLETIAAKQNR